MHADVARASSGGSVGAASAVAALGVLRGGRVWPIETATPRRVAVLHDGRLPEGSGDASPAVAHLYGASPDGKTRRTLLERLLGDGEDEADALAAVRGVEVDHAPAVLGRRELGRQPAAASGGSMLATNLLAEVGEFEHRRPQLQNRRIQGSVARWKAA